MFLTISFINDSQPINYIHSSLNYYVFSIYFIFRFSSLFDHKKSVKSLILLCLIFTRGEYIFPQNSSLKNTSTSSINRILGLLLFFIQSSEPTELFTIFETFCRMLNLSLITLSHSLLNVPQCILSIRPNYSNNLEKLE